MSPSKITRRKFTRLISLSSASAAIMFNMPDAVASMLDTSSETTYNELLKGFQNFPAAAKPWTYYMWLNGNISKEGITSDMEALHRIGIGGVLIMSLGQVQEGPVRFLSSEWRGLVKHTIAEAQRLGMQVNMNNDAGWNSGGPWITPELGMQRITWTETIVTGPTKFNAKIEQGKTQLNTYKEIAVIAIPSKKTAEIPDDFKVTANKGANCWLQHDYGKIITAQSIILSHPKVTGSTLKPAKCELSVSDDGVNFKPVRSFQNVWLGTYLILKNTTIRLGKVEGRYFRLTFPGITDFSDDLSFTLLSEPVIDNWPLKAGFESVTEHGGGAPLYAMPDEFPVAMNGEFPTSAQLVNLSDRMQANGSLQWDVPKGEWIIMRIGYTPTAKTNGAAGADGRGLDCDKVSRKALEVHLTGMIDKVIADAGPMAGKGKGLTTIHTDSWESQQFNWTANLPDEFKTRRGYDMIPWLPVMAGGRIINSVDQSERFLWDLRRTLADMIMDNHLKHFRELAHQRGIMFTSESSGRGQFLYDPVAFQVCSDLPMGEFWNSPQDSRPRPDCKIAASAAHVANLPIAGGEAFTQNHNNAGKWLESPYFLKALGDGAFCAGLNRYYFHRTIAQFHPGERPGMTWPNVGINFDTTQTWWEYAPAWIQYISRCQYLLQQGLFVADTAIITDEGAPAAAIRQLPYDKRNNLDPGAMTETTLRQFNMMPFLPPPGHDYDYIHPGAVYTMQVKNGDVVLPYGMSYKVLILPNSQRMTVKLARKIKELVIAGATIVGPKPLKSPTLCDYLKGDNELHSITNTLWGHDKSLLKQTGKGQIFKGNGTEQALKTLQVLPDFQFAASKTPNLPLKVDYIHRRTATSDIYFISNQQQETIEIDCWFRVSGRKPEFWMADIGKVMPCDAFVQNGHRTKIPLRLDPSGSIFVVFTKPIAKTASGSQKVNFSNTKTVLSINDNWVVNFDPAWGGPEQYEMGHLQSWTESNNAGVKYYSGTAVYKKQFHASQELLNNKKPVYLDLGLVKEVARIKLNGKDAGIAWKPPYRVDISSLLKTGAIELHIEIANLWPNRLIADAGLSKEKQLTKVNWNPYKPDSPLLESGLIGPVTIQV